MGRNSKDIIEEKTDKVDHPAMLLLKAEVVRRKLNEESRVLSLCSNEMVALENEFESIIAEHDLYFVNTI